MWKLIFSEATDKGTGCNREPLPGEYSRNLHPSLCAWFNVEPERYQWNGTGIEEVPGYAEEVLQRERLKKLEVDLLAVDLSVQSADKQPFTYNGHTYYPDTEFIQGMFSMLPYLPSDYTEIWKTAEKEADGLTSVYVTLDKAGIAGLASAYLQFKKDNWLAGETQKAILKNEFLGD